MRHDTDGGEAIPSPPLLRYIAIFTRACGNISALLILFSLAFTSYAVMLRYVFGAPLAWSDEFAGYLLVAIVMLGAAEAYRQGDHIAIDLLYARSPGWLRAPLALWAHISVLAFAALLAVSAWDSIRFAYDFGSYSAGHLEVAMWIPQLPILLGAVLLGLIALTKIYREYTIWRRK